MNRRESIKTMALGVVAPAAFSDKKQTQNRSLRGEVVAFTSSWEAWPDMNWVGPEYWGNRLQDWRIHNGRVECLVRGSNRTLHCLTAQLSERRAGFETSVSVQLLDPRDEEAAGNYVGFRLGARSLDRFDDYRCAAVFGEGLDVGVTMAGQLFVGKNKSPQRVDMSGQRRLALMATPEGDQYRLSLSIADAAAGNLLDKLEVGSIASDRLVGNVALVQHYATHDREVVGFPDRESWEGVTEDALSVQGKEEHPTASFADWHIAGAKFMYNEHQVFGPVCFAQYTLHKHVLKLTSQFAPIETIAGHQVELQLKVGNDWQTVQRGTISSVGRIVRFRIGDWRHEKDVPYRIRVTLPLKRGTRVYDYEGTVAAEPLKADAVKVAVFSCNADHGFPDSEIATNVEKHKPDMAVFLGDQFYESTGGFRIQTSPPHKATLDYLRKWYMFGWSYRDIFRHIPCAIIPDDHDIYHGNVWGEGGKHAPTNEGFAAVAQDQGGFKMPPVWVNMVQETQTSHLPDAFDPTPINEGINVYYTDWSYGGISFAILEDRKFKSAPKNVLPEEVEVINGFVQEPDKYDIKKYRDIPADLLGERQLSFLRRWASDWSHGVKMKAVLSQTNFCTVDTLPEGSVGDSITSSLPIPEPGEYVQGDSPTGNMDSNGWPQAGRDEAIRHIRKCFAFHIAGDQHLASFVRYGVDEFGDSGYAFAGPALNNLHPRRWWPKPNTEGALPGQPPYTGNFFDGFGNRVTVMAVANPQKTNRKPERVYDRSTGYGIVTFDKKNRTITTACWPRFVDPLKNPDGQYRGWPITIAQEDNYGRKAVAWLPTVKVEGLDNPLVEVIDERSGALIYAIRIKGDTFKPKVFSRGTYSVRVSEPDQEIVQEKKGVRARKKNRRTLRFVIGP